MTSISSHFPPHEAVPSQSSEARLRQVSDEFETAFLSEMLKHSGVAKMPEGFGGGPGEEAFSSLLVKEYSELLVKSGGLGISETVFQTLVARDGRG